MDIAFGLLGGLGLFLYGMDVMGNGLQRTAGNKLKGLLRTLTTNRIVGVLSGIISTAVVQSSTVTTVIIVGFVNAGLMALPQAISVILGAHIGTTITAQIIAFKVQAFALPIIATGALLHLFGRSDRIKSIGDSIFGLGSIFLGLNFLVFTLEPLKASPFFAELFVRFSTTPVLGLLVGIAVTVLVQSSTVTTGMTIALALASLISFEQAVPLILGENIGTTITANIAAIPGSVTAKQAARAHFIVNALGALGALILLRPFMEFVLWLSPVDTARQIANAHTIFNILTTLVFLPFISLIARATSFLIIGKAQKGELYYLDTPTLQDPETALDQVTMALLEMQNLAMQNMKHAADAVLRLSEASINHLRTGGEKIERYQTRVTEYLEKIAERKLSERQSRLVPRSVRILHEIERIRDYEEKMRYAAVHLMSEGRTLSNAEKRELKVFFQDVQALLLKTHALIENEQKKRAEEIVGIHESLNARKEELRERSRTRFIRHRTEIATANYYFDIVSSLEEISRKCRNIAVSMLE